MSADNFNYVRCRSDGRWDVWLNLSASCETRLQLVPSHVAQTFDTQAAAVQWAEDQGFTEYGTKVDSMDDIKDIKDIKLPKTTQEFAQYLRDIAEQVERIPDRPLYLNENDVEVGFYYNNLAFPQMPTGLHFAVDFASTEIRCGHKP